MPGDKPRVEFLEGTPLRQALPLLANIRVGWKGFPETNTQAYSKN
jgi:hypothetical protein